VFSQVRVPEGKFGLERLFAGTRHACLFFNDLSGHWYQGQEQEIDAALDHAIDQVRPERVVYYGSSMGAYGALMTGLRHGDGSVYAFGTELDLGRPGGQSPGDLAGPPGGLVPAIKALERAAKTLKDCHLFYGALDPVDARQVQLLGASATGTIHLHLLRSSHASHDHLYSLNIIRKIISGFERDPRSLCAERRLLAKETKEDLKLFSKVHEDLISGRPGDPTALIETGRRLNNPGMLQWAAEVLVAHERLDTAAGLLSEADTMTHADPVLAGVPKRWRKLLPLRWAELLAELGDVSEAETVLAECRSRFPDDARMLDLARRLASAPISDR